MLFLLFLYAFAYIQNAYKLINNIGYLKLLDIFQNKILIIIMLYKCKLFITNLF